jgi:hypothetical protein
LELVNHGYVLKMDGQSIASDLHRAVWDLHNPENTVRRDAGIKVM